MALEGLLDLESLGIPMTESSKKGMIKKELDNQMKKGAIVFKDANGEEMNGKDKKKAVKAKVKQIKKGMDNAYDNYADKAEKDGYNPLSKRNFYKKVLAAHTESTELQDAIVSDLLEENYDELANCLDAYEEAAVNGEPDVLTEQTKKGMIVKKIKKDVAEGNETPIQGSKKEYVKSMKKRTDEEYQQHVADAEKKGYSPLSKHQFYKKVWKESAEDLTTSATEADQLLESFACDLLEENYDELVNCMIAYEESGDTSIPIPGGLSERASGQPADQGIAIPKGTEITQDQYNDAIKRLHQSFKEGVEVLEALSSMHVIQETTETRQANYAQEAVDKALLEAYENGPVFEAVHRSDKEAVKKIVGSLRGDIEKYCAKNGHHFYKPHLIIRYLLGSPAAGQQIWSTRLWQVLGIVHLEEGNIGTFVKALSEEFKDELGDYKILQFAAIPTIYDAFKLKFGWKNQKNAYFLLVDKKMPEEMKELQKELGDAASNKDNDK